MLQGVSADAKTAARVTAHLDLIRERGGCSFRARVESQNSFPMGVGIASSASAFAALTLAATQALDMHLSEREITCLARRGSGSASRSIPTGYVEWLAGENDSDSYAQSIADPDHWNLMDLVAIINTEPKRVSSEAGNKIAASSPFQNERVADAGRRLTICRESVMRCDFERLADVIEEDTRLMHSVMMTSRPPLLYWDAATLSLLREIPAWRKAGLAIAYTVDAGPNVHCICLPESVEIVQRRLLETPGVKEVLTSRPGPGARLVE